MDGKIVVDLDGKKYYYHVVKIVSEDDKKIIFIDKFDTPIEVSKQYVILRTGC